MSAFVSGLFIGVGGTLALLGFGAYLLDHYWPDQPSTEKDEAQHHKGEQG